MSKQNIEIIKSKYIQAAKEHRRASFNGEYKIANKEYKKLKKIYVEIQEQKVSHIFLLELLESEELEVATWAAAHMLGLKIEIQKAEKLLKKIAENSNLGMLSFNAKMTLKAWNEKGELTF